MLIPSHRHTRADLDAWARWEAQIARYLASGALRRRVAQATAEIDRFVAAGACYVGTSWGKDSVVAAHLAHAHGLPLVWVRVEPIANPDCPAVRDAYLARHPADYHEIVEWCTQDATGWHATGTLERGFARAPARRYISGVRGEESSARERRVNAGLSTARTCAPIGRWTSLDVYAYLHAHDLPVHPAYACTYGGAYDRGRVRVASLGGDRGTGRGRAEWERRYYSDAIRALIK